MEAAGIEPAFCSRRHSRGLKNLEVLND